MVRIRLVSAWIALASFWTVLSLLRHHAGETSAFDLGIFQQTLWNLTHGAGYLSSLKGEVSLWTDHQSPVLWFFAPFFALIPRSETLLILQAWIVAAGIIPLTLWAQRECKRLSSRDHAHWIPLFVMGLYIFSQPIRSAVLFDFHPEILFLPLGFAWWEGMTAKRPGWWIWFGLWLLTKETAALSGIGIATLLLIGSVRGKRGAAAALLVVSMAWLMACLFIIPKWAGGGSHAYQSMYSVWGTTWWEMALAPFIHPVRFVQHFLDLARLAFVWKLSASVGFAHLLSPHAARWSGVALLAALPVLLAGDTHRVNPHYHYGIEPSFSLLIATLVGLVHVSQQTHRKPRKLTRLILVFGAVVLLRGGSLSLPQAVEWWKQSRDLTRAQLFHVELPILQAAIGPQRTLAAPERWAPRLASRAHLYLPSQMDQFRPDCVLTDPQSTPAIVGYTRERELTRVAVWRRHGAAVCVSKN